MCWSPNADRRKSNIRFIKFSSKFRSHDERIPCHLVFADRFENNMYDSSEKVYFFGFYVLTDTEILWNNTKHKHKLTKFVCQCQSIFPELSVFSHLFLPPPDWLASAQCSPLIGPCPAPSPDSVSGPDILMAAWVNIKMLAPIIIKYHFLLSFTHFVVLIASLCLMQTFTLRNKERGKKCRGREKERERVRGWGYFIIFSWKLFWLIFDYIWDRGNKEARDEK